MQKCEQCGEYKGSVFRRAEHGQCVCSECHQVIMVADRPSKYMVRLVLPKWLRM